MKTKKIQLKDEIQSENYTERQPYRWFKIKVKLKLFNKTKKK